MRSSVKPQLFYTQQILRTHKLISTKKTFWHHFDEDDEAWPKVVLILSSTSRTTTQRKIRRTFPSYFPFINRYTEKQTIYPNDVINVDFETSEQVPTDYDNGKNWVALNFVNTDESGNWEDDNMEGAEQQVPAMSNLLSPTNTLTKTWNKAPNTMKTATILRQLEFPSEDTTKTTTKTTTKSTTESTTKVTTTTTPAKSSKTQNETRGTPVTSPPTTKPIPLEAGQTPGPYDIHVVKCFQCGLNVTEIPVGPTCFHVFNSHERIYHYRRNSYKVTCMNEPRKDSKFGNIFVTAPKRVFRAGCFKRFLDIGEVYNERGCRTMNPLNGTSFASRSFRLLEKSMHQMDEGCVSSPHASLTPFSRAVTLYASTSAARKSNFMDPLVFMATKDVIVLPEDYEDEFSNLETTPIGIPEEDYYYNTDTDTAFREVSDDSYMSGQENKKSSSNSDEDKSYHEIGNIYDPWPSIPPRYIYTTSSTEYLTMPQTEYSPSKMTIKEANDKTRLSTSEFRRPCSENKLHYGEPLTEIMYQRITFPELTTVKKKPYASKTPYEIPKDTELDETTKRYYGEPASEISGHETTYTVEKKTPISHLQETDVLGLHSLNKTCQNMISPRLQK
uniref:Uncharacterized protein n=1 Tax=Heliothis virescens TaxID=7102 RepID=A0A2A4JWE2_HELVI